jgi:hypothetical protein
MIARILVGIIAGFACGSLEALAVYHLSNSDDKGEIAASIFMSRIILGFFIGTTTLQLFPPLAGFLIGAALGILAAYFKPAFAVYYVTSAMSWGIAIGGIMGLFKVW